MHALQRHGTRLELGVDDDLMELEEAQADRRRQAAVQQQQLQQQLLAAQAARPPVQSLVGSTARGPPPFATPRVSGSHTGPLHGRPGLDSGSTFGMPPPPLFGSGSTATSLDPGSTRPTPPTFQGFGSVAGSAAGSAAREARGLTAEDIRLGESRAQSFPGGGAMLPRVSDGSTGSGEFDPTAAYYRYLAATGMDGAVGAAGAGVGGGTQLSSVAVSEARRRGSDPRDFHAGQSSASPSPPQSALHPAVAASMLATPSMTLSATGAMTAPRHSESMGSGHFATPAPPSFTPSPAAAMFHDQRAFEGPPHELDNTPPPPPPELHAGHDFNVPSPGSPGGPGGHAVPNAAHAGDFLDAHLRAAVTEGAIDPRFSSGTAGRSGDPTPRGTVTRSDIFGPDSPEHLHGSPAHDAPARTRRPR